MVQYNGAVYNIKGEDARIAFDLSDDYLVLAIVDGHGGDGAARLIRTQLEDCTRSTMPTGDWTAATTGSWLQTIFASLHAECVRLPCHSGAALTMCILERSTGAFLCANVGDSGCLVVTPTSHYWATTSHRLQHNAEERERLSVHVGFAELEGARVGPPRLYPGGLSCSRSIGDGDCDAVSCIPSVSRGKLCADDVLVLASDGLWDVLSCARVSTLARETRCAYSILRTSSKTFTDDTSVIVASQANAKPPSVAPRLLFFRTGSASSLSSDDDELPTRTVVNVQLKSSAPHVAQSNG